MPRYKYHCTQCEGEITVYHGISDTLTNCEACKGEGCMQKMLSSLRYVKKGAPSKSPKAGELTKQYIEKNKEILKQQKKEAKKETYEPS